ncbi:hypothetical protein F4781DRAFT_437263 [Annulohypoxylon bovei var. microspora]|nr:hypothetical protein F4781DRAFT_437263 [Annulohypoxylon bovei var. microspora]
MHVHEKLLSAPSTSSSRKTKMYETEDMFCPRDPVEQVQPPQVKLRSSRDQVFGVPIFLHIPGTRYVWSQFQTEIFRRHIQEHLNDSYKNLDLLLEKLELDGYDNIETRAGLNYKCAILIPKVMEKLRKVTKDNPGLFKQDSNRKGSVDQAANNKVQVYERNHSHSEPETIGESPQGSPILGCKGKEKVPNDEYRINSVPGPLRCINRKVSILRSTAQSLRMIYSDLPDNDPLAVLLHHHKNVVRDLSDLVEDRVDQMARTWSGRHRDPNDPIEILDSDSED